MKNIKMIITDLDETLLTTDKKVTKFTYETIKKFTDQGILFTIASGRVKDLILYLLPSWNLDGLADYIAYGNGFGYLDCKTNEDTRFYSIEPSIVDSIMEQIKDLNVGMFYYPGGIVYSTNYNQVAIKVAERDKIECKIVDKEFFKKIDTSKHMIGGTPEEIDYLSTIAKQYDYARGFKGTPTQYEYVDIRDSKSNTIKHLINKLGISTDEIIAFGDTINDADMLAITKNSVAMINGDDSAKSVSNYVTKYSNNEDGVAKFLLENIEI